MNATRSVLVLGMFGSLCFVVAGVVGLASAFSVIYLLFVLIGAGGLVGGPMLWRRV